MRTVEDAVGAVLSGAISAITQRSIFNRLGGLARTPVGQLGPVERQTVLKELESSLRLFARGSSAELLAACERALTEGTGGSSGGSGATAGTPGSSSPSAGGATPAKGIHKTFAVEQEKDIATARLEAWSEAVRIGLSKFTAVKVATAVSELARNIVFYAGKGTVELRATEDDRGPSLHIVARDKGPGIEPRKLEEIWAGTYKSQRGMGKGLLAVKKLVTDFHLDTGAGKGTTVTCVFRGDR
ncbi:MAG TPA: ATP-binding protein [Thermoanaerobaculia bacterium]|nr:ATP-binding protein [Thermoanaerobaculia bacterium]